MLTLSTWFALHHQNVDPSIKQWLEKEFQGLWEHLGQGEPITDFDLTQHGPLWVATSADNRLTWQELTTAMLVQNPEFVERHRLADGRRAFRIGFLLDNDFMPLLYAPAECLDSEIVRWLEEETEDDEEPDSEDFCDPATQTNPF